MSKVNTRKFKPVHVSRAAAELAAVGGCIAFWLACFLAGLNLANFAIALLKPPYPVDFSQWPFSVLWAWTWACLPLLFVGLSTMLFQFNDVRHGHDWRRGVSGPQRLRYDVGRASVRLLATSAALASFPTIDRTVSSLQAGAIKMGSYHAGLWVVEIAGTLILYLVLSAGIERLSPSRQAGDAEQRSFAS